MKYDIIVLGSGPGGYPAAIKAAQLGFKVAVVEKSELGGICLNWGCIPTKALLKSAQVYKYAMHSNDYGVEIADVKPNVQAMVERSRVVSEGMNKGIHLLFKKNNIDVLVGRGKLIEDKKIEVTKEDGTVEIYEADRFIIATGARSKVLPNIPQDGNKIIGYREAMTLKKQPKSMIVVGSGAIGCEFAYFYHTIGTEVTIVEFMDSILPVEDDDVSKVVNRSFKKSKLKIMTSSMVKSIDTSGELCKVEVETKKGIVTLEAEIVLSAVGITTNIENIGLEELGIKTERSKVVVDDYYRTNIDSYYAVGDIVHGQALAHVATKEAEICVEKIKGHNVNPIDYNNIPGCTYTSPEVASVGFTEKQAIENNFDILVGKFPFTASGKAFAAGNRDGFVKVIIDKNTDELLGAHMVGENVTEMIAEIVVARDMKATAKDIMHSVHPHPTMSEAIMEALADAYGEAIHL